MTTVRVKHADPGATLGFATDPDEEGGFQIDVARVEDAAAHGFFVKHLHEEGLEDDSRPYVPPTNADGLRLDGPTFEEFVKAGYPATRYPPSGYAEKASKGWTAFLELKAKEEEAAPKVDADDLRLDGPTFEAWVENGNAPDAYPPEGYAELESEGYTTYLATLPSDEQPASGEPKKEEPNEGDKPKVLLKRRPTKR